MYLMAYKTPFFHEKRLTIITLHLICKYETSSRFNVSIPFIFTPKALHHLMIGKGLCHIFQPQYVRKCWRWKYGLIQWHIKCGYISPAGPLSLPRLCDGAGCWQNFTFKNMATEGRRLTYTIHHKLSDRPRWVWKQISSKGFWSPTHRKIYKSGDNKINSRHLKKKNIPSPNLAWPWRRHKNVGARWEKFREKSFYQSYN